ncbi:competence/damage-inducible protein A [Thermodesulfobacteriota bacterium]
MDPVGLDELLAKLPKVQDPNLLVGYATNDDAAVYQLSEETALVTTADFITPPVDDPYLFGQIAAANAISDIYAMGGRPILCLNLVAFPSKRLEATVLHQIIAGALDKITEAGAVLGGGHSIEDAEPKFGLAVTGVVHPGKIWTNSGALPGDVLVLTKPIGSGVIFNANLKNWVSRDALEECLGILVSLNKGAAEIMAGFDIHAATDITGFGLAGHSFEMAKGSGVTLEMKIDDVPILREALDMYEKGVMTGVNRHNREMVEKNMRIEKTLPSWHQEIIYDPQTSGGLMVALPESQGQVLVKELREGGNRWARIITIGNELVSGRTIDLNSWYAAGRLTASGLGVSRISTVGDDPERVSKVLKSALKASRYVITTGGLGTTEDDMTNEIVAKALKRPLCRDEDMYGVIKNYVAARGMQMSPSLEKMAWTPQGSRILNLKGSACGFSLVEDRVNLYFLPGVPDQMRYLMDRFVIPEILSQYKTLPLVRQRILKLYGLSEPGIAEALGDFPARSEDVILGFYPHYPENHITISLRGHDEPTVTSELDRMEHMIRKRLGPFVFASGKQNMEEAVGERLKERHFTISVAESCTGGLIGNLLTNASGSSAYFQGGMVVYSNRSKEDLLGVSPETLTKHGAVSNETVREMAAGIKKKIPADMGLAITGIAGPEGGSPEKPVGTVHIGLAVADQIFSDQYRFWGNRGQIKSNAALMSLDWIRRYLDGDPFLSGL